MCESYWLDTEVAVSQKNRYKQGMIETLKKRDLPLAIVMRHLKGHLDTCQYFNRRAYFKDIIHNQVQSRVKARASIGDPNTDLRMAVAHTDGGHSAKEIQVAPSFMIKQPLHVTLNAKIGHDLMVTCMLLYSQ